MESDNERRFEVAFCPQCKEKQPVNHATYRHKENDAQLIIVYCAVCETVLNLDGPVEVELVDDQWFLDRGYVFAGEVKDDEE